MRIPDGLEQQRGLGRDWGEWLDRLPRLVEELVAEWELRVLGAPMHGYVSLVVPVRTRAGNRAALKVSFDGDEESEHEGLALQRWGGRGAVRLLRQDPRRRALLLEWMPGGDLAEHWDVEACEIVGGLYRHLHQPAPPQLRPLTSYVERWAADLDALGRDIAIPRRLVQQALSLARDLVAEPGERIVHGDLHYDNVLAGADGRYRAIDPKPMSGDPHYEPAPMLWNRMDELEAPGAVESVREALRRRFHTLVDAAGLDEHRARDWVVVRMVLNASWTVQEVRDRDRAPHVEERHWLTRCITIAKAVQD